MTHPDPENGPESPGFGPRFHATPEDAVREVVRETVLIDGHSFRLDRPSESDLLDHPAVRAAYAADQFVPYWAELWPAGRMLAKAVLKEPWVDGLHALEIGCGLGLAGIAALKRGLRVTFSDVDALAVRFASANARLNGFSAFDTAAIDLRRPPDGLSVGVLLGSDLMYEERHVGSLVAFIAAVLAPGGLCLLADPDRETARTFKWRCQQAGLEVAPEFARAGEPGGGRTKGTVYRVTWPGR